MTGVQDAGCWESQAAAPDPPSQAAADVVSVQLVVGPESWEARTGDPVEIPPARHALRAIEDAAVLLTAVPHPRPN